MVIKYLIAIIICINYGQLLAQYQYLGVKQVNQMEAPSLESAGYGIPMSNNIDDGETGGPRMRSLGQRRQQQQRPQQRSMDDGFGEYKKDCGWRDVPHMRSLDPPKTCKKKLQFRSLDANLVTPNIKMINRKKEESECKIVRRVGLKPTDVKSMEKDLKPNRKETIETYTEVYVVTSIKTITKTRRRVFMQKRKIVNQRMNRPIMIIRRKIIKERQVFERIVPKVIETREIIHKPTVESKIVEGPIYEIDREQHVRARMLEPTPPCPEVEFDPNVETLESVDADAASGGQNNGYLQK
ncbi:unnamed protein product [Medioppia subpectinata]|uniref:Uncharacterized protein n=1 Tax=Medioppia subpectinata TaxID=1979941 RepID=A0A7R9KF54_9ACAR|nr:unnamed protein product [Medioppia subpectinata]CAG2101043.1 unnamed protein product [Medioppia subpectinata]